MKTIKYKYPGDPPSVAEEITRLEFQQRFPNRSVEAYYGVTVDDMIDRHFHRPPDASFPMTQEEIYCDFCNDDPLDDIFLIDRGTKALCRKCAEASVLPYEIK